MQTELLIDGLPEPLYVVHRDAAAALQDLWSRVNLHGHIAVAPERRFTDESRRTRMYSAFQTGDGCGRYRCVLAVIICSEYRLKSTQLKLPDGVTTVPVQIFVDKTQLCNIVGVESNVAYPLFATISTIDPSIRLDISNDGYILIALLPTGDFDLPNLTADERRNLRLNVFHAAVRVALGSLISASDSGLELTNAVGDVCDAFPILAIDTADYPEQCVHALARYGVACPKCYAQKTDFSQDEARAPRTPEDTMKHIKIASELDSFPAVNTYLKEHGLNYVLEPFWKEWAHVNIHDAITPDILHQLYQGVIKHLVKWLQKLVGKKELDARMQRTPKVHGLRSFEKGISVLQRISGTEHKAIAKQLLPNVADGQIDRRVVRATRAILDFTRIASYECHSDDTLVDLEKALSAFHENKDVFIELGACKCASSAGCPPHD